MSNLFCVEYASATPFDVDLGAPKFAENPLGDYRILVICLPGNAAIKSKQVDPLYASMDWDGFADRDLVITEMRKYSAHVVIGHGKEEMVHRYEIPSSSGYGVTSGERLLGNVAKCKNELEYVLIGKDQTAKRRWDLFPPQDELYGLIDAMPMRRFEMRQKADKN